MNDTTGWGYICKFSDEKGGFRGWMSAMIVFSSEKGRNLIRNPKVNNLKMKQVYKENAPGG